MEKSSSLIIGKPKAIVGTRFVCETALPNKIIINENSFQKEFYPPVAQLPHGTPNLR
jgi:hypothetical protein